jgi:hypothetical protein
MIFDSQFWEKQSLFLARTLNTDPAPTELAGKEYGAEIVILIPAINGFLARAGRHE